MVAPRKYLANGLLSGQQAKAPPRGLLGLGDSSTPPTDILGLLSDVYANNRGLARHKDMFNVTQKQVAPDDPRQLEYYPPWESWNPTPGKATLELYNTKESPEVTKNLIAGDMMHYLGSTDPRTNQPPDPTFHSLKQKFMGTLTPEQMAIDRRAYAREAPMYENPPSFEDWMQFNRGDAYLRGYLTPDANDEWRRSGTYTPEQIQILEALQQYLRRGSIAPGMNR